MKTSSSSFKAKAILLSFILIILGVLKSNAQNYDVTSLGDGGTTWDNTCTGGTFAAGTFTEGVRQLNDGLVTSLTFSVSGIIDLSARTTDPIQICANGITITGNANVTIRSTVGWMPVIEIRGNNNIIENLIVNSGIGINGGDNNILRNNTINHSIADLEK